MFTRQTPGQNLRQPLTYAGHCRLSSSPYIFGRLCSLAMPRHRQRCECGLLIHPNDTVPHLNGNRHRQRMSTSTVAPARAAAAGVRGRQQPTTTRDGSGGGVGFNPVYALALATYASSFIAAREEDHDVLCEPCNKRVPSRRWEAHLRSAPHRRHEQFIAQQQELESATVDKNGIRVSAQVDFGIVGLMDDEGATYRRLLNITKPEAEARVLLLGTQFASAARGENLGQVFHSLPIVRCWVSLIVANEHTGSRLSSSETNNGYFLKDGM
jgi:hypothetical protein